MRTGRPKAPLVVTDGERQQLISLTQRARTAPQLARRARIVLACAEGFDNKRVARRVRVAPGTVTKWRVRFVADRVDGLYDEARPGTPAHNHGCADRGRDRAHVGIDATRRDALEHPRDGQTGGRESYGGAPDLACVRPATASDRDVQTVARPAPDRQGAHGKRGVIPQWSDSTPVRLCPS